MIAKCQTCKVQYNNETVNQCPICFPEKEAIESNIFSQAIHELRTCVKLSRKGKHHKQPSGMHIVFDKKFKAKII